MMLYPRESSSNNQKEDASRSVHSGRFESVQKFMVQPVVCFGSRKVYWGDNESNELRKEGLVQVCCDKVESKMKWGALWMYQVSAVPLNFGVELRRNHIYNAPTSVGV